MLGNLESSPAAPLLIAPPARDTGMEMAFTKSLLALALASVAAPLKTEDAFDVVLGDRCLRINSVDKLRRCQILGGRKSHMEISLCRIIGL